MKRTVMISIKVDQENSTNCNIDCPFLQSGKRPSSEWNCKLFEVKIGSSLTRCSKCFCCDVTKELNDLSELTKLMDEKNGKI